MVSTVDIYMVCFTGVIRGGIGGFSTFLTHRNKSLWHPSDFSFMALKAQALGYFFITLAIFEGKVGSIELQKKKMAISGQNFTTIGH